jgi:hypothetical protein
MASNAKAVLRRGVSGWPLALALLMAPGCAVGSAPSLNPGFLPYDGLVFCDIERPDGRQCVDLDQTRLGVPLAEAAIALATHNVGPFAVQSAFDPANACMGREQIIRYYGPFPQGLPVCLNCSQVGDAARYHSPAEVCAAKCRDLVAFTLPPSEAATFCAAHATVSTNYDMMASACYEGGCTSGGMLLPAWDTPHRDPRNRVEPVIWTAFVHSAQMDPDGTLQETDGDGVTFDAGAVSEQIIQHGDAKIDFTATETMKARLLGISEMTGRETDPGFRTMNYAIDLFRDGHFYVFEDGEPYVPPDPDPTGEAANAIGRYAAGMRFGIEVRERPQDNRFAFITYYVSYCPIGLDGCYYWWHQSERMARYPLRVDASLREHGATIGSVNVVYIHGPRTP